MSDAVHSKWKWEKCSVGSGVTDLNIGINGWILFSLLHIKLDSGQTETTFIVFNHILWERWTR